MMTLVIRYHYFMLICNDNSYYNVFDCKTRNTSIYVDWWPDLYILNISSISFDLIISCIPINILL